MINNFFKTIVTLIYPPKCVFCGTLTENSSYYCENCILQADLNFCYLCNKNKTNCSCTLELEAIISPLLYKNNIRKKLVYLKTTPDKNLVDVLTTFMVNAYQKEMSLSDNTLVVPVPSSKHSIKNNGFNQAQLLAESFAKKLSFNVDNNLLARTTSSLQQKDLDYKQRVDNAEKSYYLLKNKDLTGINIIIVDDISTTGSTLNACAKALEHCKPKRIIAVCAASTPKT